MQNAGKENSGTVLEGRDGRPMGMEIDGLQKNFGTRRAVRGISLRVAAGSTLALLGPNGAGKTTTIRMLSCLLKPSGGRARVAGYDLRTEAKQIKRRIGVSPQETAIAGRLTTRENLLLIGAAYGLDPKLSKRRAEELLAAMGLEKRARDRAAGLSGGLARRLSIAMALVADPPVLFLDEPSLGLDPEARSELWTYLGTYKGQKTILLTTHYLEEADNLADSIAVLVDGSILASGSPEEIKNGTRRARRIHVKVLDLAEEAFQSLLAISPSLRRTDFGVEAEGGEADALSLLDGLRAAEARVTGFSVDETSLDEAYLALIGKESKL